MSDIAEQRARAYSAALNNLTPDDPEFLARNDDMRPLEFAEIGDEIARSFILKRKRARAKKPLTLVRFGPYDFATLDGRPVEFITPEEAVRLKVK